MKKISFRFHGAFGDKDTTGWLLENGLVVHKASKKSHPCWLVSRLNGYRLPGQPVMGTLREVIQFAHKQLPAPAEAKRKLALDKLRTSVKKSRFTYSDIAQSIGVSTGWVGNVLRGNYPSYKAHFLPKNIRVALEKLNFDIAKILVTY